MMITLFERIVVAASERLNLTIDMSVAGGSWRRRTRSILYRPR